MRPPTPLKISLDTLSSVTSFWRDIAEEVSIRKRKRWLARGRAAALVEETPCPRRGWQTRHRQPRMRDRFMFGRCVESVDVLFDCGVSNRAANQPAWIRWFE